MFVYRTAMSTYNANEVNIAELSTTIATFNSNVMNQTIGTLNASVVNYSTNKPTSEFVLPREQRSQVTMSGKDYENTNYQAATDGSGNPLNFFIPTAQGRFDNQMNLPEFGAFSVTSVPGTTAMQQTFQGVCDLDFVYFIWEIGAVLPITWTGTSLAMWQAFAGKFTDWEQPSSMLVKLDRNTGDIVQIKHIGIMMDEAYLAAGSTLVAQSAVGPGVYVPDSSDNPLKDSSGNYVTHAVTGLDKNAPGYFGFQTSNVSTWVGGGDDNARGPMQLYEGHLYMAGNAQKYASVFKVRCSDLTLVWRRTIDPFYEVYDNGQLTSAGLAMRQIMVIPPRPGRANAFVVTTATDNFSYSTIDLLDVGKLWNYYKSGGTIQAWEDFGATASADFKWQTLIGPKPLALGDELPETLFRKLDPGATFNPMTVDGVIEQIDSSGYFLDETGNVSIDVYVPLTAGYVFTDGSANGDTAADCKTTGVFNLLTGRRFTDYQCGIVAIIALQNPGNPADYPQTGYQNEFAKFDFSISNINVTQLTAGAFNVSANYTGTIQNGPFAGDSITVTGQDLLNGVPDALGRLFPAQNYGNGYFQPVTKRIYLAQVGRAILDQYELSELNTFGGGCYMSVAYDSSSDVFITPTGQMVGAGHNIETVWGSRFVSDVSCNGIFYPGVTTSYKVPDLSGGFVTNAYTDDNGDLQYPDTFYGAGTPFFRGLDDNDNLVIYKQYDFDFVKNNPTTGAARAAAINYYYSVFQTLGCNADSSGIPLSNVSTNPQLWIPGGDATGNVTARNQGIFMQSRHKAYWDKTIMMRDNLHLGARYNRQGQCGFTGVKVGTGELMFSVNTHGYDVADHSTDFESGIGGQNPISTFRYQGYNHDGCSVTLLNMADSSANITSNATTGLPEAPFQPIPNRRILLATTKTRTFMFDYDLLVDKNTGDALTITHVAGDATLGYEKGCATNTWKDALLYESDFGASPQAAVFNAHATDGSNFIHNVHGLTRFPPFANILDCMVPGKEVHGHDMDPYTVQSAWMKPIGSRDPQLLTFFTVINTPDPALGGNTLAQFIASTVDPTYTGVCPDIPPVGSPAGGATDVQLQYMTRTIADLKALLSGGPNPALEAVLAAAQTLLNFLGWSQLPGAINYATGALENGSFKGLCNPHINCYNLQAILNNTLASNVQVASNAVTLGLYYKIAALGSSSLSNLQAYFSALDALPGVGQEVIASATGVIAGGATVTQVLNTPYDVIKYQYLSSDIYGYGWANQGPQVYGKVVLKGNSNGIVEAFDINTGFPLNQPKPIDASGNVDPQGVPNIRTPNVGIYNSEGQRVIPLIADGIMYGYGGNNKWTADGKTQASKVFMWTPYGK